MHLDELIVKKVPRLSYFYTCRLHQQPITKFFSIPSYNNLNSSFGARKRNRHETCPCLGLMAEPPFWKMPRRAWGRAPSEAAIMILKIALMTPKFLKNVSDVICTSLKCTSMVICTFTKRLISLMLVKQSAFRFSDALALRFWFPWKCRKKYWSVAGHSWSATIHN